MYTLMYINKQDFWEVNMYRKIIGVVICALMILSFFPSTINAITLENTSVTYENIFYSDEPTDKIDLEDEQEKCIRSLPVNQEVLQSCTLRLNLDDKYTIEGIKHVPRIKVLSEVSNFETTSTSNGNVLNPAIERGNGYYCIVHEFIQDGDADIMVERKTVSGGTWEGWYFEVDGAETIPDIDYWGSGGKFYAVATHSNNDYFYYIEIPDIADESNWVAHILDWSGADYNFDFYDSTSVGCYNGRKVLYAVIGSTNYPGYECDHSPMILYTTGDNEWTIRWFSGLEDCSHISIDIDQDTGVVYLAFDKDNDLYLIFNDYDNGLDDDWQFWHIDESYDMRYPDVSAGHGAVYMAAQTYCEGDWDPWFFYSTDNDVLYYGWLLGTEEDERYPRVSLTYDGSHIIGNWVYTKKGGLYSGPDDKVSGDYTVEEHYRCCDVASGHAAWTITSEEYIITNDIQIGDYTPVSYIDSISPNPADENEKVKFKGHGWDPDGWVTGYKWESDIDGELNTHSEFSTSNLSVGTHTISFKVKDNKDVWSIETTGTLVIKENSPPTAFIDKLSPNPAYEGMTIHFEGHGYDIDGHITSYNWRSSIDGYLSDDAAFDFQGLSAGLHTIYFKVKDDDGKWSSEVKKQLEIIKLVSWTQFKPDNAGTDYCYTTSYYDWHTDETDFPFDAFAEAEAGANYSSGFIGGACLAVSSDLGEANGWAEAFQKVSFYTSRKKTVHITAEIYLIYSEIEIGIDTRGETKIGHMIGDQKIWDKVINKYFDWDYILSVILNLISVFGLVPGTIIQAITMGATIADYALLAQEFYDAYNRGDAKKYIIEFDMTTNNDYDNCLSIGARVGVHTAWFGEVGTGFIGLVDNIVVDGIAPPSKPIIDGPSQDAHGKSIDFSFNSIDPNNDKIKYSIWWGDGDLSSTDYYSGGTPVIITHTYDTPGTYTIKVEAMDEDKMVSESNIFTIEIGNSAPNVPSITRKKVGFNSYEYSAVSNDPEKDKIRYIFEFMDGHKAESNYESSGTPGKVTYKNAKVRAKAKDYYGAESSWSDWKSFNAKSAYPLYERDWDFLNIIHHVPFLARLMSVLIIACQL